MMHTILPAFACMLWAIAACISPTAAVAIGGLVVVLLTAALDIALYKIRRRLR